MDLHFSMNRAVSGGGFVLKSDRVVFGMYLHAWWYRGRLAGWSFEKADVNVKCGCASLGCHSVCSGVWVPAIF